MTEEKADGAVASDFVFWHAATGATTMDLVNAMFLSEIEFAPRFDEDGALAPVHKEFLQRGAFVIDKYDWVLGVGFDFGVIETFRYRDSRCG